MSQINLRTASTELQDQLREARWKCRTDLLFLCNNVLGFKDVSEELHGPVIRHLQQFPGPESDEQAREHDKLVKGVWEYTPVTEVTKLPGKRRMLLLDARGFMKTTINCIAHTIQWIINYPDMAMLIMQSNSEKAIMIVGDIKKVFTSNDKFRALFPELCPTRRLWEWGKQDSFVVEDRRYQNPRGGIKQHREPTVLASSIERGMAGVHVDVIKCSDVVEPGNINSEGLEMVKRNFFLAINLLVSPQYWMDVEGTRYHFADLYGRIIEMEEEKIPELRQWNIFVRGATKRDWGSKTETFNSMEFLLKPEFTDEKGYAQSRWPDRFPNAYYAAMKMDNPLGYSTQQQQDPRSGGVALFPVDHQFPKWISPKDFVQNIRVSHYDISIDTAETTGKRSDYTSIVVGAWSASGKCYILEIEHGRFSPLETVDKIVAMCRKYKHRLGKVKIEQTGFVRGLMPALRREMDISGLWIPIEEIKRDNQEGKVERIALTLQPWYVRGDLVFVDGYSDKTKNHLLKELREFPAAKNDDILDSLSDLFQGKTWFGRESARHFAGRQLNLEFARMVGVLTDAEAAYLGTDNSGLPPAGSFGVY